ncbi:HAD family hydrolase [Candidatus Dojkabacteria bacterium]|nr:HAD family hydrolase [Candidatus Dojkabacteria bacterium]
MKNIQTVLFDLDDTLLQTNAVFTSAIEKVKEIIGRDPNNKKEHVSEVFEKSLARAFNEVSVNPVNEWPLAFKYMREEIEISDETLDLVLQQMYGIYTTAPELTAGAVEILEYFSTRKYKVGLVTHAIEDWTNLKLDTHGLRKYFTHIEICDTNRHKNEDDWRKAFDVLQTHPSKGLIIGDNVRGDIIAGKAIGVEKLIWINNQFGWKVYQSGEVPEGTIEVKGLLEIIDLLEKQSD